MGGRRRRGDTTRYIDEEEREICPSSSRLNCCWSGNVSIKWVVPSVTRWTISLWSLTNQSLRDKSRNRVYHLFFIRNHRSSARTNLLLSSSITRRCEPNELPAHSVRQQQTEFHPLVWYWDWLGIKNIVKPGYWQRDYNLYLGTLVQALVQRQTRRQNRLRSIEWEEWNFIKERWKVPFDWLLWLQNVVTTKYSNRKKTFPK